jgi:hypothetical protein
MLRQRHPATVVRIFLIGCFVLLAVDASEVRAEASQKKKGYNEVRGTSGSEDLVGGVGNDVIYGGPGDDSLLFGDDGDDVIYGGEGNDSLSGGEGKDRLYGGDGNDRLQPEVRVKDEQPDKLYCGKGKDQYAADKKDYVDSSCEKKTTFEGRAGIA